MVTANQPTNQVNLEQVCSLNIEQSRLLQYGFLRYSISEMAYHFETQIGHGSGIGKYLGSGRVLGTCWALLMIHRTQKV